MSAGWQRPGDQLPGWQATFGPFRLIPTCRQLLLGDRLVRLGGRAFDVLEILVENAGELVEKRNLCDRAWPNLAIDETNLRTAIAALRRALREDGSERTYIETDPGRGYRLAIDANIDTGQPRFASLPTSRTKGSEAEIHFGPFCLNRTLCQLRCGDRPVKLGQPSYKVLDVLLAHAGQTIDNLTLIQAVWGSLNIEASSLRAAIAALRRAMTDAGCKRMYITTVPRRGYRFSEPVTTNFVTHSRRPKSMRQRSVIGREALISAVLADLGDRRSVDQTASAKKL